MVSLLASDVLLDFLVFRIAVAIGICLQKGFDRLDAGKYITFSAGRRWDTRFFEVDERGIAHIIADRRFRIPMSESVQQPGSFLVYHGIVIV